MLWHIIEDCLVSKDKIISAGNSETEWFCHMPREWKNQCDTDFTDTFK
jgi:hypothetical protein